MTNCFISYARADQPALDEMCVHLSPVQRELGIHFWRDQEILAGEEWNQAIEDAIEQARIHLLFISTSFLSRPYVVDRELPAINAKYRNFGDLVIPIVFERCMWKPFVGSLEVVPKSPRGRVLPINEWRPIKHGFNAAGEQVRDAIVKFLDTDPRSIFDWSRP